MQYAPPSWTYPAERPHRKIIRGTGGCSKKLSSKTIDGPRSAKLQTCELRWSTKAQQQTARGVIPQDRKAVNATETITRTAASPQGNAQVMVFGFASKLTSNKQRLQHRSSAVEMLDVKREEGCSTKAQQRIGLRPEHIAKHADCSTKAQQ